MAFRSQRRRGCAIVGRHTADARSWLEGHGPALEPHPAGADLGLIPGEMGPSDQERFARGLAGETMGSGPKKGSTYRWIPARLRDADGAIVPRSFLRLLRRAAEDALRGAIATSGPLMDPPRLVGALRTTSEDRVAELREEYPFVQRLENLDGQSLLMARASVVAMLSKPTAVGDGFGGDGNAVLDELRRIGVSTSVLTVGSTCPTSTGMASASSEREAQKPLVEARKTFSRACRRLARATSPRAPSARTTATSTAAPAP